jgi:hypothetical protein
MALRSMKLKRLYAKVQAGKGKGQFRKVDLDRVRTIQGVKYDRSIIKAAEIAVKGEGDGRISEKDAKMICKAVRPTADGRSTYDGMEKRTMAYVRRNFKFTAAGDQALRHFIAKMGAKQGARTKAKKGAKRTASKAAGGAQKKRASSVAKQCAVIAPSIKGATSLPEAVRSLISDRLVHVFGTYKEDRDDLQNTAAKLVGDTLSHEQESLQKAINEATEKKAGLDTEGAALHEASETAAGKSEEASKAMADASKSVAEGNAACKEAKSALHGLETAVKNAETETAATASKKEKLEALINEFFTPVKAGTLDKGLKASAAYAAKYIGKEFDVAPEFVTCVIRTFSKAFASWATFDHIVAKELDEQLQTILAGLAAKLEAMAVAKEHRATEVEGAKAAVTTADENAKAAEEALKAASEAAKEAKNAAKVAAGVAKQQLSKIEKAGSALETAEGALAAFNEGPLAAYTGALAHTAPPPPPEPEEAPAAEEVAEPAAAPLDAIMTPAPAVQRAPSVLPSPALLASAMVGRVAQAVGLAPSPRVAASPREA